MVMRDPGRTDAVLRITLNDCTASLSNLTLRWNVDGPMSYSLSGSRTGASNENIELTGLIQEQTYEYTVWVENMNGQTIGSPVSDNFTTGL